MKILFILSGGLDSTTALYDSVKKHEIVEVVTFHYGQRHKREIQSAQKICKILKLRHQIIDIKNLNKFLQGSSLTTKNIRTPHGHYHEENMKQTIVPNRNAIFINIAAGYAISQKIYGLGLGIHAGDHYIYPDCRPEFLESQIKTLNLGNECDFKFIVPFLHQNKTTIVKKALQLKVPAQHTWTCYEGKMKPCSQCGSCIERIEAFLNNNQRDPLYTAKEWLNLGSKHHSSPKNQKRPTGHL